MLYWLALRITVLESRVENKATTEELKNEIKDVKGSLMGIIHEELAKWTERFTSNKGHEGLYGA
jgi:hypothetical protein